MVIRILKFFAALLIIFKVSKLFRRSNKIIFRSVSSKILDLSANCSFRVERERERELTRDYYL